MKILAFHAHAGDPLSFVIKALTRSQYCHGAILIDRPAWKDKISLGFKVPKYSGSTEYLIVEAYWPKVRARYLLLSELAEIDVFDVPSLTPEQEDAGMQWLLEQLSSGVKYDVVDLFRFTPEARNFIGESSDDAYKQHTFCSMLVFNAYRFAGIRLLNCHDYECSPDKLDWSPFVVPAEKLK